MDNLLDILPLQTICFCKKEIKFRKYQNYKITHPLEKRHKSGLFKCLRLIFFFLEGALKEHSKQTFPRK